jgi:transcriptional regulator with GAF, ATPase, and Fis domain
MASGPGVGEQAGTIPPELLDSHLFGHEKGSFTGASEQRQGWFERADRLAVFPIVLPPLRERRADIPELAHHFAERAAARPAHAPAMWSGINTGHGQINHPCPYVSG